MVKQFVVGKSYFMRSVCDHNCVWQYKIKSRTAKTIKLIAADSLITMTCRVKVWAGVETVMPLGSYSMAPQLSAEKVI